MVYLFNEGDDAIDRTHHKVMKALMISFGEAAEQNAELTAKNAQLTAENAKLTAENAKLTAEKQTAKDKTKQQASTMRELMVKQRFMQEELERLQAENDQLKLQQTEKKPEQATTIVVNDNISFQKLDGTKNGAPMYGLSKRQELFVVKNELGQWTVTRRDGVCVAYDPDPKPTPYECEWHEWDDDKQQFVNYGRRSTQKQKA